MIMMNNDAAAILILTLCLVHTVDPFLTRLVRLVDLSTGTWLGLVNRVDLSRDQKRKENEDKMEIRTAESHVCAQKCSKVYEITER